MKVKTLRPGQSGSRSKSRRCKFVRNNEILEVDDATVAWCFDDAAVSVDEAKLLVDFEAGTRGDLVRDSRLFWTAAMTAPYHGWPTNSKQVPCIVIVFKGWVRLSGSRSL